MNLYNVLSNRYVGMSNFERLFAQKFGGTGGKIKELEGVPPLTFTANGQPLLDYRIYGNMEQNGTPTPENPIIPRGCGERTENLFDISKSGMVPVTSQGDMRYGVDIGLLEAGTYTINYNTAQLVNVFVTTSKNGKYSSQTIGTLPFSFTLAEDMNVSIRTGNPSSSTWSNLGITNIVLVPGSTAPESYIPYGYKLPLTSAGQNVDIYLGEVQTTRRIKKLVLTGRENWRKRTYGDANYTYEHNPGFGIEAGLCSHYARLSAQNIDKVDGAYLERTAAIIITDLRFTTTTDFKAFLAAQYANGTPVTVWCAITTEEIGIVNEPLMKIGDYADTVSKEQAGVSIPTNKGSTTLDVDTTIKPSNVYIKYKNRR